MPDWRPRAADGSGARVLPGAGVLMPAMIPEPFEAVAAAIARSKAVADCCRSAGVTVVEATR